MMSVSVKGVLARKGSISPSLSVCLISPRFNQDPPPSEAFLDRLSCRLPLPPGDTANYIVMGHVMTISLGGNCDPRSTVTNIGTQ